MGWDTGDQARFGQMARTLLALGEANHGFGGCHIRDTSLNTGTPGKRSADGGGLLIGRALYGVIGLATAAGAATACSIEDDVHGGGTFLGHLGEALLAFKDRKRRSGSASKTMDGQTGTGVGRAATAGGFVLREGGSRSEGQSSKSGGGQDTDGKRT